MFEFLYTLVAYLFFLSLLDFIVKARYVTAFERRMDSHNKNVHQTGQGAYISWQDHAIPFFKDTGPVWKWRNVLVSLWAVMVLSGLLARQWWFCFHFICLFPLEFVGYWLWVGALKRWFPQRQYFVTDNWQVYDHREAIGLPIKGGRIKVAVRRLPKFGEVPAQPLWLPKWYRRLGLHTRPVVYGIILLNFIAALVHPKIIG